MDYKTLNIEINNAHLHVELMGNQNEKTIMFIHGGPGLGDSRADLRTFSDLADNYRLVFIDMRGSGRSSDTPPFTHEQWIKDIDTLRVKLGINKFVIHGSSYGGFIAQEYAIRYPEYLSHLILNVTSPDSTNESMAIENALSSNECDLSEEELKRLFEGRVIDNDDFKYLYSAIQPLYSMSKDLERDRLKLNTIYFHYQTHNTAFKNLKTYDMKPVLKNINIKTLITAGEKDWITPKRFGEKIHNLIPNSTFVVYKDLGHSLIRENPNHYQKLMREFIENRIDFIFKEI